VLQIPFRFLDTPTIAHIDVRPLIGHSHRLPRLIGTWAQLFAISASVVEESVWQPANLPIRLEHT
jgi:hypothetical protein